MTYPYTAQSLRDDILQLLDVERTGAATGRYNDELLYRRLNLAQHRLDALLSRLGWPDWLTYWVAVGVYGESFGRHVLTIPMPPTRVLTGSLQSTDLYWRLRTVDGGYADELPYVAAGGDDDKLAPSVFRLLSVRIIESPTILPLVNEPWVRITSWTGRTRLLRESNREDMFEDVTTRDWTFDDPPKYRLNGENTIVFDRYSDAAAGFLIEYTASAVELNDVGTSRVALQPLWAQYLVADVVANLAERNRDFALADRQRAMLASLEREIEMSSGRRDSAPKRIRDDQTFESGYRLSQQEIRDRLTFGPWWP